MKIKNYSFGRMDISEKTFTSDVIIFPHRILSPWWRDEGHYLQLSDIEIILEYKPDILIIGTGYYQKMRVDPKIMDLLKGLGIELHILNSREAVELFNSTETLRKVGAFHLTC